MVGVGGTQLFVNTGETYNHETTWNVNHGVSGGAGGGGMSSQWTIPAWQQGVTSTASAGSTSMRNVPDVSLNADQYTGYSVFFQGNWWIYGGTSCAAPLWAAFTARVNQLRAAGGAAPLGFANPAIYQIARGSRYSADFHDIADGTTNLYYPAVTGYDDATGWGSFNGANLLADLSVTSPSPPPPGPPSPPTNLVAAGGNATVTLSWTGSSGAASYSVYRSLTSGQENINQPLAAGLTATSYNDTAVINGTTYYYTVTASNTNGMSGFSNEASATPQSQALSITSGPSASSVESYATIQWTTNSASTSLVYYGTNSVFLGSIAFNGNLVKSHSVTLSRLLRGTRYYYKVSSTGLGRTA